jgi:uncharacterized phiE125 gp8 family phage protein
MTLQRTGAPEAEPVLVSEAKAYLRLDTTSEDELIAGLIRAARDDVEHSTGLALIDQTWRLALDAVPPGGIINLPRHPVREILAVTCIGNEGEASLVPADDWVADLVSRPARLYFRRPPVPMRSVGGIEVGFRAGFGEAGTDVPDLIKRAMLSLVAHWYEHRAGYAPDGQPATYPPQYERLIAPWRQVRV